MLLDLGGARCTAILPSSSFKSTHRIRGRRERGAFKSVSRQLRTPLADCSIRRASRMCNAFALRPNAEQRRSCGRASCYVHGVCACWREAAAACDVVVMMEEELVMRRQYTGVPLIDVAQEWMPRRAGVTGASQVGGPSRQLHRTSRAARLRLDQAASSARCQAGILIGHAAAHSIFYSKHPRCQRVSADLAPSRRPLLSSARLNIYSRNPIAHAGSRFCSEIAALRLSGSTAWRACQPWFVGHIGPSARACGFIVLGLSSYAANTLCPSQAVLSSKSPHTFSFDSGSPRSVLH
ncbi:hypothetical protein FB451DRAFT_1187878 [Mycena latifolia]|nr:hypothetical protein FB451DRAFT_1187878 [Mycena latifolia]